MSLDVKSKEPYAASWPLFKGIPREYFKRVYTGETPVYMGEERGTLGHPPRTPPMVWVKFTAARMHDSSVLKVLKLCLRKLFRQLEILEVPRFRTEIANASIERTEMH